MITAAIGVTALAALGFFIGRYPDKARAIRDEIKAKFAKSSGR